MRCPVILSLAFACLLSVAIPCSAQTSTRPRLAIMDFSPPGGGGAEGNGGVRGYGDVSSSAWGDPGRMMAELLTTHIAKSGRFEVIERARLYQLLNERQINLKGLKLGEQVTAIGKDLGVQSIVVAGYQAGRYGYEVAARVVATADGAVQAAENVVIPADPTLMDESLAILAVKLMTPFAKERGYVLDVFLETDKLPLLMVDLGTAQGAKVGRKLEVSTLGDPVIHPVTKENLGNRDVPLATAAIVQTQKEFCYARVTDRVGVMSAPVKRDAEGIDLGIERMQRVRLLDETTESADSDLTILNVTKYVQIRCDIPDAKLLVDGKAASLGGGSASVRVGAGTHLVEVRVGDLLISREMTITRQGGPKELAFRKDDLATAVAVKPPEPAAAAQTVVARTAPQLSAEDQKVDAKLVALLPKPEAIDEQLRAARDEAVIGTFEAGLRALRYGYARGNRSYLSMAALRFGEVVKAAPELALGHFNLGLAKFYLDYLDDAKAAFDQAMTRDKSLEEDVPLLWWDDFSDDRNVPGATQGQRGPVFEVHDGVLTCRAPRDGTPPIPLYGPDFPPYARDVVTTVRYRMVPRSIGPSGVAINVRVKRDWSVGWWNALIGNGPMAALNCYTGKAYDAVKHVAALANDCPATSGWHTLSYSAVGPSHSLYLDGRLLCATADGALSDGAGLCVVSPWNDAPVDIDWVLVTRY